MRKKIATSLVFALFALPASASAQSANEAQLISLYTQLVQILQQQLQVLMQNQGTSARNLDLAITPMTGTAPLDVSFKVVNGKGTEAIDFGDGFSTGNSGCQIKASGFCDLSMNIGHTYRLPGTYSVALYSSSSGKPVVVKNFIISVAGISAQ